MVFGFLFLIAVVGILFYLLVIQRAVPGAVEQRFGVYEALPADVGKWKVDENSDEAKEAKAKGQTREVRYWFDENAGFLGKGRLVRQVRYRNATNEIVRVDPEEVIERKRVRT
jgi:hypothetical protein